MYTFLLISGIVLAAIGLYCIVTTPKVKKVKKVKGVKRKRVSIDTICLTKKGKGWPHKHKWVPLRAHPRGGDVCVVFMLEAMRRIASKCARHARQDE